MLLLPLSGMFGRLACFTAVFTSLWHFVFVAKLCFTLHFLFVFGIVERKEEVGTLEAYY